MPRASLLPFRCLLLLLLLLPGQRSQAQVGSARYFLKHFGSVEGLPQPFIYTLAQDHAGYLWIGTAEGLVRYDGTEFVTYTTKDGLAEDFVTALYVQPRTGQLWVSHYQGGVSRRAGPQFKRVPVGAYRPAALGSKPGIASPDITYYNKSRNLTSPPLPTLRQLLPPGATPQCILQDREHNLWIGTAGRGLWRWSDRHVTLYPSTGVPSIATISALSNGGKVAGLLTSGQSFLLDPLSRGPVLTTVSRTRLLPYSASVLLWPPDSHPQQAVEPQDPISTYIWAGTNGHGLWQRPVLSLDTLATMQQVRRLPARLAITALTQRRNGDLWIGTALDGVYRLPADSTQPAEHFTTANGLLHNSIHALTTDLADRVWIGTHDTGLAVWQRGRFLYHRSPSGGLDVSSLLTDNAGRVWIGTEGNGVLFYENNRFKYLGTANGLLSPYCYALVSVRWGNRSSRGRYRYSHPDEQVLVIHRNGVSLADSSRRYFTPVTLPDNPLVRNLLPQAAVASGKHCVWLRTRAGLLCLRTNMPSLLPSSNTPLPTLLTSEVDGAVRSPQQLGELSTGQHRVSFRFRAVSLLPGQTGLQYQYRLRGYQELWSRPTPLAEAQFPQLDAGRYSFEVRARLSDQGAWSQPATASFSIAAPFWRKWWFAMLSLITAGAGVWAFVRGREAILRQQKLQLETTVRERTRQLRRQKDHIEEMNVELTVARDAAEASQRAKAQFLANMSHEIRTPMNAVIGLTHLLRQTPVTHEQKEYLEAVQSSSQNLLVIIDDILDSSKIEAGKLTLERTPFHLPDLLRRVASMFRFATETKQLHFHLDLAPDVPTAVLGDPVRLNQVLINLIGNAVKFTTTGGVTVCVTVADAENPEQPVVRFAVQDTGIGIPANKLDAIFEDFSQANTSTTRQFGGTGLGLSIARSLVELHGGRLWVESTENIGSVFSFDIAYPTTDPATVPVETSLAVGYFEPALSVLVAEDNELNQLVARKTLEAWNVRVTIAPNGRLAVQAAETTTFDAVLMDVQMPEMDGYEAARQLRARFPDAQRFPIIGLTASALPEDRALALAAGMNDTLAKPFDPALLFTRLAHYTGRATLAPAATTLFGSKVESLESSLDLTLLEELAGGNKTFIKQVITTFLTQAPALQQQLADSFLAADTDALARTAHKLKGQVAYFGVEDLHVALEGLEQRARHATETAPLADVLHQVEQQLDALYGPLRERAEEINLL